MIQQPAERAVEPTAARRHYLAYTPRTRIRLFTRKDVDRWLAWERHADPLYAPYNPLVMSGSMRDAWYDDLVNRQGQLPFAVDTLDGRMIGRIFLRFVNRAEGSSVLGIDFDPGFVGQGYGTEALSGFLDYYFERLGFRRMLLSVAAYNRRARSSYERCGWRYVGSYWDRIALRVDIWNDERLSPEVRSLFRRGRSGLETLYLTMRIDRVRSDRNPRSASNSV
jgi:RimJ/RimL family protein N-acetyltransferase